MSRSATHRHRGARFRLATLAAAVLFGPALVSCAQGGPNGDSPSVPAPTASVETSVPPAADSPPASSPPAPDATASAVDIRDFAFSPAELTVPVGTTITWTNSDSTRHSVRWGDSESPVLATGATYERTFDTPGTYAYDCGLHPSMHGTVVVVP